MLVSATVVQPQSAAMATAAPDRGINCLASESRLRSISALLMTRVAMDEQAKAARVEPLGLYVHVPFCASTCDFCAFYQVTPTADAIRGFIACVSAEAGIVGWDRPLSTVFWGGGTPGLLSPGALGRLAEVVRAVPGGAS